MDVEPNLDGLEVPGVFDSLICVLESPNGIGDPFEAMEVPFLIGEPLYCKKMLLVGLASICCFSSNKQDHYSVVKSNK